MKQYFGTETTIKSRWDYIFGEGDPVITFTLDDVKMWVDEKLYFDLQISEGLEGDIWLERLTLTMEYQISGIQKMGGPYVTINEIIRLAYPLPHFVREAMNHCPNLPHGSRYKKGPYRSEAH